MFKANNRGGYTYYVAFSNTGGIYASAWVNSPNSFDKLTKEDIESFIEQINEVSLIKQTLLIINIIPLGGEQWTVPVGKIPESCPKEVNPTVLEYALKFNPYIKMNNDGIPADICPSDIGEFESICDYQCNKGRLMKDMCKECWNQPTGGGKQNEQPQ